MMKLVQTLFLFLLPLLLSSQQKFVSHDFVPGNLPSYKPAFQHDYPAWAKMLYQENVNYDEVDAKYEKWVRHHKDAFRPIQKYFQLWKQNILPFVLADGTLDLTNKQLFYDRLLRHQQTAEVISSSGRTDGQWTFYGPKETFWLNESGSSEAPNACPWQVNVYSFDVSKSNPTILYGGTETGYVNKSIDNGFNWELLGLGYNFGGGVTAVAIHPTDDDIVYVAAGMQIHKTMDGGITWTPQLPSSNLFYADNVAIDPNDPDKIFAAGSSGVFRSENGGTNWSNVWSRPSYDVHLKPNDSNIIYVVSNQSGYFQVAVSSDGGSSFATDNSFPTGVEDAAGGLLAVSPDRPDELFGIFLSAANTPLIYKGDMVNANWSLLATGQTDALPLNNGQGFFDLVLEVSPIDADIIFAGTTTLFKSTNGGTNFSTVGGYGGAFPIHPDIQSMKILENGTSWVATDGGLTFSSDNFVSTTNAVARNKNLIGSDMWGFDQGWNEDIIVGGRYHNGNTAIADFYQQKALRMGGAESPTGWVLNGRSRHVAFDDLGPGWILPETPEAQPQGRFLFTKHPNMDEYGGRRGNLFAHPNYYGVLYLGEGNGFWRSEDFGTSFELLHDFGNRIRFCQIAYDNPNIIYADIVNEGLHLSQDGGLSWTPRPSLTNGAFGNGYWEGKLHFVISPNDADVIYACLQNGTWSANIGKIFKSTDGGLSWEDWTGSLSVFTKTLAIQPDASGEDLLYLFTTNKNGAAGQCYTRAHDATDWTAYADAYPAGMAPNHALPFFRDSKIRIAGNGGIWENELAETNFEPILQAWVEKPFFDCMLDTIYLEDHSIINHEGCTWGWDIQPAPLYIDDASKRNPKVVLGNPGSYDVTMSITKNGETYTKTIANMISTIECPSIENCDNPGSIPRENWALLYVDSEEVNFPGLATMSFDNDPGTIWHTRWSTGSDPYPHEIQIDLGANFNIYEFTYYTRTDGQNGRIRDYELYFSDDPENWGEVDATGVFENTSAPQKVTFQSPLVGRYLRLVALSEVNGNAWASAAEFEVKACYYDPVSIQEVDQIKTLKAFPVPTNAQFTIPLPSDEVYTYSIYNLSGQLMEEGRTRSGSETLECDLSDYANGMYMIKVTNASNRIYRVKVLKQ